MRKFQEVIPSRETVKYKSSEAGKRLTSMFKKHNETIPKHRKKGRKELHNIRMER